MNLIALIVLYLACGNVGIVGNPAKQNRKRKIWFEENDLKHSEAKSHQLQELKNNPGTIPSEKPSCGLKPCHPNSRLTQTKRNDGVRSTTHGKQKPKSLRHKRKKDEKIRVNTTKGINSGKLKRKKGTKGRVNTTKGRNSGKLKRKKRTKGRVNTTKGRNSGKLKRKKGTKGRVNTTKGINSGKLKRKKGTNGRVNTTKGRNSGKLKRKKRTKGRVNTTKGRNSGKLKRKKGTKGRVNTTKEINSGKLKRKKGTKGRVNTTKRRNSGKLKRKKGTKGRVNTTKGRNTGKLKRKKGTKGRVNTTKRRNSGKLKRKKGTKGRVNTTKGRNSGKLKRKKGTKGRVNTTKGINSGKLKRKKGTKGRVNTTKGRNSGKLKRKKGTKGRVNTTKRNNSGKPKRKKGTKGRVNTTKGRNSGKLKRKKDTKGRVNTTKGRNSGKLKRKKGTKGRVNTTKGRNSGKLKRKKGTKGRVNTTKGRNSGKLKRKKGIKGRVNTTKRRNSGKLKRKKGIKGRVNTTKRRNSGKLKRKKGTTGRVHTTKGSNSGKLKRKKGTKGRVNTTKGSNSGKLKRKKNTTGRVHTTKGSNSGKLKRKKGTKGRVHTTKGSNSGKLKRKKGTQGRVNTTKGSNSGKLKRKKGTKGRVNTTKEINSGKLKRGKCARIRSTTTTTGNNGSKPYRRQKGTTVRGNTLKRCSSRKIGQKVDRRVPNGRRRKNSAGSTVLECPDSWLATDTHCYKELNQTGIKSRADIICKEAHPCANVPTFQTEGEFTDFRQLFCKGDTTYFSNWIWLGYECNHTETRADKTCGATLNHWETSPIQPSNADGTEYCTAMQMKYCNWHDGRCDLQEPSVICQLQKDTDCYKMHSCYSKGCFELKKPGCSGEGIYKGRKQTTVNDKPCATWAAQTKNAKYNSFPGNICIDTDGKRGAWCYTVWKGRTSTWKECFPICYSCPDGWSSTSTACYKVIQNGQIMSENNQHMEKMSQKCKTENLESTLPWFATEAEFNDFKKFMYEPTTNVDRTWLAINDAREERVYEITLANGEICPAPLTKWGPNEPDNAGEIEKCTEFTKNIGINDISCGEEGHIPDSTICQIRKYKYTCIVCPDGWNSSSIACYKVIGNNGQTMSESLNNCKEENSESTLPWFATEVEYKDFKDFIESTTSVQRAWLGINDKKVENVYEITLANGEICPSPVIKWGHNEPDNAGGVEKCTEFSKIDKGINDNICGGEGHIPDSTICQIRKYNYTCEAVSSAFRATTVCPPNWIYDGTHCYKDEGKYDLRFGGALARCKNLNHCAMLPNFKNDAEFLSFRAKFCSPEDYSRYGRKTMWIEHFVFGPHTTKMVKCYDSRDEDDTTDQSFNKVVWQKYQPTTMCQLRTDGECYKKKSCPPNSENGSLCPVGSNCPQNYYCSFNGRCCKYPARLSNKWNCSTEIVMVENYDQYTSLLEPEIPATVYKCRECDPNPDPPYSVRSPKKCPTNRSWNDIPKYLHSNETQCNAHCTNSGPLPLQTNSRRRMSKPTNDQKPNYGSKHDPKEGKNTKSAKWFST